MDAIDSNLPLRRRLAPLLAVVLIVALVTRYYAGPAAHWVNNLFPSALYVVFWCLFVQFIRPDWQPRWIVIGVFAVTCVLEFAQLSDAAPLEFIRQYEIGRLLIGTWFDPWDFVHYVIGAALAWLTLIRMRPS